MLCYCLIMEKRYDLEERTFKFSRRVRVLVGSLPRDIASTEDGKQLIRSSGSVGANYIEANEALSKKDFIHRVKICRKEAKETIYWLNLLSVGEVYEKERSSLVCEGTELMKIFGAIVEKCK